MAIVIVICVVLAVLAVLAWGVMVFNRLVRHRNQVRTAWSDIDVQLTRRHDLVPALVAAVRGYAAHERGTLDAVTTLRAEATQTHAPAALGAVENRLAQSIGHLVAVAEAYPDLKASANFAKLQGDLVDVEEQLQYARRFYNGAVRDYNDAGQRLPDLVVARTCGFEGAEFFQAADDDRAAVTVDLTR